VAYWNHDFFGELLSLNDVKYEILILFGHDINHFTHESSFLKWKRNCELTTLQTLLFGFKE
jgi:hypothetical protein